MELDFKPEITPVDSIADYEGKISVHSRVLLDSRAEFATKLMGHLAIVACDDVAMMEDKAGNAVRRLSPPADLVKRACDIADAAFTEFAARGWAHPVPSRAEICARVAEEKRAREQKIEAERAAREEARKARSAQV